MGTFLRGNALLVLLLAAPASSPCQTKPGMHFDFVGTAKHIVDARADAIDGVYGLGFILEANQGFGATFLSDLYFSISLQQGNFTRGNGERTDYTDWIIGLTIELVKDKPITPFLSAGWGITSWKTENIETSAAYGLGLRGGIYFHLGSWFEIMIDTRYVLTSDIKWPGNRVDGDYLAFGLGLGAFLGPKPD